MGASASINVHIELGGSATAFSEEATVNDRDDFWRVLDDIKNIFDPRETFVVEVSEDAGGSWEALGSGEFTLLYLAGVVDIDDYSSLSGNTANIDQVRISGHYIPRYRIIGGHSHDLQLSKADLDITDYGKTGHARTPGLEDATGSFEVRGVAAKMIDGPGGGEKTLEELFSDGDTIIFSYDPTGSGDLTVRASVKFFGHNLTAAVSDLVDKSVAFQASMFKAAMAGQSARVAYLYER